MADSESRVDEEQRYRASAYALLAALLREAPGAALLEHVATLASGEDAGDDEVAASMIDLARAAREADPAALEDEYHALFIGLGRGELVPYGSYYLTGFLMEQPLSELRDDLRRLGFVRTDETREPEDHITALFEVFSVMIADGHGLDTQQAFHGKHLRPWSQQFFEDLGKAESAKFYRFVARFGAAMTKLENNYLSLDS